MTKEKTRIKIKDLPKNKKISKEEMKKVFGGYYMPPIMVDAPEIPPSNWPSPQDVPPVFWRKK